MEKKSTNNKVRNICVAVTFGLFIAARISDFLGEFIGLVAGLAFGVVASILFNKLEALKDKLIANKKAEAAKRGKTFNEYEMRLNLYTAEVFGLALASNLIPKLGEVFVLVGFILLNKCFVAFLEGDIAKKEAGTAANVLPQEDEKDSNL